MKKLAEKLKKPGGEEKLRNKIEKYLKQAPEKHAEADDENLELRKQLPNDIIRKLKQMNMCPTDANLTLYRMDVQKYCSRYKIDSLRKVVQNWTNTLNIKKKDFLGRNVKKGDVFKYVSDKLESLVLDRPQSDSEYKEALQNSISEIVYELPLSLSSHNKDFYLNKVTENLVDSIFMIQKKLSSTYIQPTTKEIKEFVRDEITFFLKKCRVTISMKRMEYLETELIDLLLDLTDVTDIDNYVANDVTKLLREVVKLPEYKAKYFTNLLLKNYKEFFFRENFFNLKGNSELGRPDVYSAFQNATRLVDFNSATTFDTYRQRLVKEINKWITKLDIPVNNKNFIEVVVKDLASDIVDRYKYMLLNPNLTGTDAEELEQIKFLIFKWTNKLVGEETMSVLEHAQELMNEINNIPKPSLQNTCVVQSTSMSQLNIDKINSNNNKSYIDILTDRIYDWYCELPINLHTSQDARHNKLLIKELARDIKNRIEKKEDGVIDIEVDKWTGKVFKDGLDTHYVQELKQRISNVPYTDYRVNYLKHEKNLIRSYEDIVDEWIDAVPIASKKQELFINNKNEIVHALAVKIHKIKSKISHYPVEVVENKLQEELSHWLKKLPLHVNVDNQNDRDKYAAKLVKSIQEHNIKDSVENHPVVTNDEPLINQLEKLMLEWLKKLPIYKEKSSEKRAEQEVTIKRLAHKLNQTISEEDADENIIEQVRMLDLKQKEYFVKNTAFQLKKHLQNSDVYKDLYRLREQEYKFFVDTVEVWLKDLPLQITDDCRFNKQKTDFIKGLKRLMSAGTDNAVMKKEILIFMRSLPFSHKKKYDFRYLNQEVSKLLQRLQTEDIGNVSNQSPSNTITDQRHNNNEIISNTIKEWISTLPLRQVYCPRELHSFIDDMSSVVTSLLLKPEPWTAQNDAKLHREISEFLRRFPLVFELSTESHVFRMTGELSKTLKNVTLFRKENSDLFNNVTVYDISVGTKNTTADYSIKSIKENDINKNSAAYTKQLVQQIGEWLDRLNLPDNSQEGFKEVAINDLAGDIVDRHKFLELNPNNTGTAEDELEHLKYQIFKWINKLVGEETHETIVHAHELMQRINSIPVPMLVRPQDKAQTQTRPPSQQMNSSIEQGNVQDISNLIRQAGTSEPGVSFRNSPTAQQASSNRMTSNSPSAQQANSHRFSGAYNLRYPNSKPCCSQEANLPPPLTPEKGNKDAVYDKYVKLFREQCNALPMDESTPSRAMLADQARRAIYNGILKTFFNLKSDPTIENDYKFFEFMLEEKLDDFLDVLPQTEELKKMRHSWKVNTIERAIEMLDELHKLSDKPCFRRTVKDKFNRQFALDNEIQYCFLLQQGFLSRMADAYILQTNYKEKDPVKANIYRNRLMMEVDRLANHMSKVHNAGFRFFDTAKLSRIAMQALEHVPVPTDDVLQEEVEQIHIADEIEKWYKELPTKPYKDENDGVFRKRMMEILAKKLNDMHKSLDDADLSEELRMKHEISHFLEKRAELQENEDKNINFMVDQLHFRLKNRWAQLEDPGHFEDFEKAKPFSSTLAYADNADLLAPLMDANTSTSPQPAVQRTHEGQEYFIQPSQPIQNMGQVRTTHGGAPYTLQDFGYPGSPQKAIIHSIDPNVSRQVLRGVGAPCCPRQAPTSPRIYLEGSQFGQKQINITQQRPNRPNLSQQSRQTPIVRQNPQLTKATPKNTRGACQIGCRREQSINQSLRQVGLGSKIGPQRHCDEKNMASQITKSGGQQGPVFVPCQAVHSQRQPSADSGIISSRGPSPSKEVETTAQAATYAGGAPVSSEENALDGEFRVRCRCLEVYRRMQRSLEADCDRIKPPRCPY